MMSNWNWKQWFMAVIIAVTFSAVIFGLLSSIVAKSGWLWMFGFLGIIGFIGFFIYCFFTYDSLPEKYSYVLNRIGFLDA